MVAALPLDISASPIADMLTALKGSSWRCYRLLTLVHLPLLKELLREGGTSLCVGVQPRNSPLLSDGL